MDNKKIELFAQVWTKSNYAQTNFKWLQVWSFNGSIITCRIPVDYNNDYFEGSSKFINADFNLSEIKKFNHLILNPSK